MLLAVNLTAQDKQEVTAVPAKPGLSFAQSGQQLDKIIGRGIALGDFNGDGHLDAWVANQEESQVCFGDGRGGFTPSGRHQKVPWGKPVVGDINGDERLEVITGNIVWLNDGKGQFTAHPELIRMSEDGGLSAVALADLNGDGHPDLFAIRDYAAMRVYFNDGKGHFRDSGQKLGDGTIGKGQLALIALGDINGDGSVDAVTAGWRWEGSTPCPNHVWLNDGKGNFRDSGQTLDEGGSHAHGLALVDLNGDGRLDLVMGIQDEKRSGRVYLNDGKGRFTGGANLAGAGGENLALADFDGDGRLDVFVAATRPPSRVWLNEGTGKPRDSGVRLGDRWDWDVAAGDLNGDGKPDAITVGFVNNQGLKAASPQVWLNTSAKSAAPSAVGGK